MEEAVLAPNKQTFVAKEMFILKNPITVQLEMIVEQSRVVRQPFVLDAKTKITLVSASPLSQVYTFTVDITAPLSTTDGNPLIFSVEKEILDKQKNYHNGRVR